MYISNISKLFSFNPPCRPCLEIVFCPELPPGPTWVIGAFQLSRMHCNRQLPSEVQYLRFPSPILLLSPSKFDVVVLLPIVNTQLLML